MNTDTKVLEQNVDVQTVMQMADRIKTLEYNVNLLSRVVIMLTDNVKKNRKDSKTQTALAYIMGQSR